MKNGQEIIYASYARKSSEAEDKQALSIESQDDELKKLAKSNDISLCDEFIFEESHSAKKAFARPVFERLLQKIESRSAQGILVWHPNRLSRNAVDAARLIQLMDEEKLVEIRTPSQTFRNTPQDKFFFQLMTSQAKMDNDQKGIDVKRGLRKKNQMGFPGGVAKPGYINDYGIKGQRKIKVDPDRFELVRQIFELFLSGKYSVRKLVKYADGVLGLRSIQRSKEGGKPLALSRLYTILKDPFCAGFFFGKDENGDSVRYEVHESVPRMITEEQYWEIQTMLGRKGAPRPSVYTDAFPYKGKTHCGTCGGGVTAEHKYQVICSECRYKFSYRHMDACPRCETKTSDMTNPVFLHYIYYHCTKKKDPNCPEGSMREERIDNSMAEYVENNFAVSKALSEWCIRHLDELSENDKQNEYERKAAWQREKAEKQKEYDELVRMKMKGLIDDDAEFLKLKACLKADIQRVDQVLNDAAGTNTASLEEVKKAFSLIVGVAEAFRNGSFDEKQEALSALGSNLTLKDKKLTITGKELFSVIANGLVEAKGVNNAFEPKKCGAGLDESEVFASVRPTLLRGWDSNPQLTP